MKVPREHEIHDLDNIAVSDVDCTYVLEENFNQFKTLITYGEDRLGIQMEPIKNIGRGIPGLSTEGSCYRGPRTDKERQYMQIALDPRQPPLISLEKFFTKLDIKFSSEAFKKKLFGDKHSDYDYDSIVKHPARSYSNNNPKNLSYVKFSFNKFGDHNTTKLISLETGEFINKYTMTEACDRLRFLVEMKIIVCVSHLWISKTKPSPLMKKMYGVKLILDTIEYGTKSCVSRELIELHNLIGDIKPVKSTVSDRMDNNKYLSGLNKLMSELKKPSVATKRRTINLIETN
jgi:hypothetical protein